VAARRGPGDFYVEALKVLEAEGFPALTAAGLCDRMGVTRGSFYHHFESFDAFVERLLEYWEQRWTIEPFNLVSSLDGEEEQNRERVLMAQQVPHGAEAAIRMWASANPQVAKAQRRVDRKRREVVARDIEALGLGPEEASVLADIAVSAFVGMQLLHRPVDPNRMAEMIREIQRQIDVRRREAARR
jgi:AcrR family transcriptional regulator